MLLSNLFVRSVQLKAMSIEWSVNQVGDIAFAAGHVSSLASWKLNEQSESLKQVASLIRLSPLSNYALYLHFDKGINSLYTDDSKMRI